MAVAAAGIIFRHLRYAGKHDRVEGAGDFTVISAPAGLVTHFLEIKPDNTVAPAQGVKIPAINLQIVSQFAFSRYTVKAGRHLPVGGTVQRAMKNLGLLENAQTEIRFTAQFEYASMLLDSFDSRQEPGSLQATTV